MNLQNNRWLSKASTNRETNSMNKNILTNQHFEHLNRKTMVNVKEPQKTTDNQLNAFGLDINSENAL